MTKPPRPAESAVVGREWINPEASHVVLVGAVSRRGSDLTQLPGVRHNLAHLRRIFLDPRVGGFPEDRVSQFLDPTRSAETGRPPPVPPPLSDDNGNSTQITRVHSLAVDLGP